MPRCTSCDGQGYIGPAGMGYDALDSDLYRCSSCDGGGWVDGDEEADKTNSSMTLHQRINNAVTLYKKDENQSKTVDNLDALANLDLSDLDSLGDFALDNLIVDEDDLDFLGEKEEDSNNPFLM